MAAQKLTIRAKVTPKSLRVLARHNLLNDDNRGQQILKLYIDDDNKKLREVCEAVFVEDFSQVDFDEIDCEQVSMGVRRFLLKSLGISQISSAPEASLKPGNTGKAGG